MRRLAGLVLRRGAPVTANDLAPVVDVDRFAAGRARGSIQAGIATADVNQEAVRVEGVVTIISNDLPGVVDPVRRCCACRRRIVETDVSRRSAGGDLAAVVCEGVCRATAPAGAKVAIKSYDQARVIDPVCIRACAQRIRQGDVAARAYVVEKAMEVVVGAGVVADDLAGVVDVVRHRTVSGVGVAEGGEGVEGNGRHGLCSSSGSRKGPAPMMRGLPSPDPRSCYPGNNPSQRRRVRVGPCATH